MVDVNGNMVRPLGARAALTAGRRSGGDQRVPSDETGAIVPTDAVVVEGIKCKGCEFRIVAPAKVHVTLKEDPPKDRSGVCKPAMVDGKETCEETKGCYTKDMTLSISNVSNEELWVSGYGRISSFDKPRGLPRRLPTRPDLTKPADPANKDPKQRNMGKPVEIPVGVSGGNGQLACGLEYGTGLYISSKDPQKNISGRSYSDAYMKGLSGNEIKIECTKCEEDTQPR